jgi:hypothetical protein
MGKDLEGDCRGLIHILSRQLPKGTEENHEESNRAPCEYESEALPLRQPAQQLHGIQTVGGECDNTSKFGCSLLRPL